MIYVKNIAIMTFNALGTKMKDSDKTLAEFLGIDMPVEKPEKAEAKVYTENLKEVVVELNDASLVDAEKLEDVRNYRITGEDFRFAKAELKGNKVILLIANELDENDNVVEKYLVEGRTYSLLVRNIDKDINATYKFKAEDNTIPAVEKVESLGEYGIKVTTTEPVSNPRERNFLIDGKNVAMVVEQYGRDIILTPYYSKAFPADAETLTVRELVDYSGFRSASEVIDFEMITDDEGPEVVSAVSTGREVTVTFDKDVYNNSISAYYGIKIPGNISYLEGRHPIYATEAEKVDTNKVVYTFKEELPRRVAVTIEGVQNHSKVAMEKVTVDVVEIIDYTEPEIINKVLWNTVADGKDKSSATIRLYFDKDVDGIRDENDKTKFDASEHFTVYEREVLRRNKVDAEITAKYLGTRKDVIEVTIEGLSQNNYDGDYDYVLEISDFWDINSERNVMYRDYMDFDIWPGAGPFNVVDVTVYPATAKTEIAIAFNKAVDRVIAEDPTNYIFETKTGARYDVKDLGGEIITERNGKVVTLVLPEFNKNNYDNFRVLDVLKDKDGTRLSKTYTYDFASKTINTGEYTLEKVADADDKYNVIPNAGVKEITLRTNLEGTFIVDNTNRDLEKLVIDAPNAHIVIEGHIDEVEVKAIGSNSLQINGSVDRLVVNTDKKFKVTGEIDGIEIEVKVKDATILLEDTEFELEKDVVRKVVVDEYGNVELGLTDEDQEELDKEKAKEALEKATEAVEKAEETEHHDDVNAAQDLVDDLPEGGYKVGLQARLDVIKEANKIEITKTPHAQNPETDRAYGIAYANLADAAFEISKDAKDIKVEITYGTKTLELTPSKNTTPDMKAGKQVYHVNYDDAVARELKQEQKVTITITVIDMYGNEVSKSEDVQIEIK